MQKNMIFKAFLMISLVLFTFNIYASKTEQKVKKNKISYTAEQNFLFDTFKTRRSVRKFKSTSIPKEHIEKILEMACSAPTSGNQQPWKFLIIQDRQKLNQLRDACLINSIEGAKKRGINDPEKLKAIKKRMYNYYNDYLSAPVNVVVLTDSNSKYPSYNKHDGPMAASHLMVAAEALGYGTVYATDSISYKITKKVFNIPDNFQFVCFTPIGVPVEWPKAKGKKTLKDFLVYEKFELGVNYTIPKKRIVIKLNQKILKKYIGEYKLNPQMKLKVFLNGQKLFCQATGQPKVEMFAEKNNFFFLKVANIQIEFIVDENIKISGLILYQNGEKIKAPKLK